MASAAQPNLEENLEAVNSFDLKLNLIILIMQLFSPLSLKAAISS